MSDAVSKLYAEIGFKVNQDGLKQAEETIKRLAKMMSDINNATKEAAKQYGIFSKDQSKQALNDAKVATEASKQALNQKRIQIMGIKELQRQEDRLKREQETERKKALKERMEADKLISKHEEIQNKEAEKNAKMRTARLKEVAGAFKSFAISVSTALVATTAGLIGITGESRKRALNVRDFQFETGVGFEDLQKYRRQFNIIGSNLSPEDLMNDLANIQQNLVDISLGKGNLSGYKLAGVRASARMGSAVDVIESLRKVATTTNIDNAMLINVMKDMGIKNAGQWLMNFRNVRGDDSRTKATQVSTEQINQILGSSIAFRQLSVALENLKDQISANISPVLTNIITNWKERIEDISISLKKMTPETEGVREGLTSLLKAADGLAGVLAKITSLYLSILPLVERFGNWLGDKFTPDTKKSSESLKESEKFLKNVIEYGKKGELSRFRVGHPTDEAMAEGLFGRDIASAIAWYQAYTGGDKVKDFNNDKRIGGMVRVNYTNSPQNNVTINGVYQDELKEELKKAVEENEDNKNIRGGELSLMNNTWVMSGSLGDVSAGAY